MIKFYIQFACDLLIHDQSSSLLDWSVFHEFAFWQTGKFYYKSINSEH